MFFYKSVKVLHVKLMLARFKIRNPLMKFNSKLLMVIRQSTCIVVIAWVIKIGPFYLGN